MRIREYQVVPQPYAGAGDGVSGLSLPPVVQHGGLHRGNKRIIPLNPDFPEKTVTEFEKKGHGFSISHPSFPPATF